VGHRLVSVTLGFGCERKVDPEASVGRGVCNGPAQRIGRRARLSSVQQGECMGVEQVRIIWSLCQAFCRLLATHLCRGDRIRASAEVVQRNGIARLQGQHSVAQRLCLIRPARCDQDGAQVGEDGAAVRRKGECLAIQLLGLLQLVPVVVLECPQEQ